MAIGFTGTRQMLTGVQGRSLVIALARYLDHDYLHHGDCEGSDRFAHYVWRRMNGKVHHHPGDADQMIWAMEHLEPTDRINARLPYLERNKVIVRSVAVLIATPKEAVEVLRSGTWATIREARRQGVPVITILPTGEQYG